MAKITLTPNGIEIIEEDIGICRRNYIYQIKARNQLSPDIFNRIHTSVENIINSNILNLINLRRYDDNLIEFGILNSRDGHSCFRISNLPNDWDAIETLVVGSIELHLHFLDLFMDIQRYTDNNYIIIFIDCTQKHDIILGWGVDGCGLYPMTDLSFDYDRISKRYVSLKAYVNNTNHVVLATSHIQNQIAEINQQGNIYHNRWLLSPFYKESYTTRYPDFKRKLDELNNSSSLKKKRGRPKKNS